MLKSIYSRSRHMVIFRSIYFYLFILNSTFQFNGIYIYETMTGSEYFHLEAAVLPAAEEPVESLCAQLFPVGVLKME